MAVIQTFKCKCGNKDPHEAKFYDGALGYEAIVCKKCGRYYDQEGEHKPDSFSYSFVGLPQKMKTHVRGHKRGIRRQGYCIKCGDRLDWSGTGWGKNDSDQCVECYNREEGSE